MLKTKEGSPSRQEMEKGGLVYLKYTYRYRNQFGDPDGEGWPSVSKILGNFTKKEDEALTTAFGARVKRTLNRVFDAIHFVYPNYSRVKTRHGQEKKSVLKSPASAPK
jgi:hypothetical protein